MKFFTDQTIEVFDLEIGSNAKISFSKKICLAILFLNSSCPKMVVIANSL